jgi:hypothetical protein
LQQKLLITPAMCSMLQLLASKLGQQPSTLLLGAADAVIANMLWFSLDSLERFTQFVESVMRPETFIAVVMVSLKISISSNGDVSAEGVGTPAPRTCNTAPVLGPHEGAGTLSRHLLQVSVLHCGEGRALSAERSIWY